jgi:hypothetical protein
VAGHAPPWLDPTVSLPQTLWVREVRFQVTRPGFRTKTIILVTTLVDATCYPLEALAELYLQRWEMEVCQTQPIKMPRCPLRLFRQPRSSPRGGFKRENVMDVNRFSRADDFIDQALGDSLTFFKRELVKVMA